MSSANSGWAEPEKTVMSPVTGHTIAVARACSRILAAWGSRA